MTSGKATVSAIIGLILVIAVIALVIIFMPVRDFPGWWILLIVVLVVGVGLAVAMSRGGAARG